MGINHDNGDELPKKVTLVDELEEQINIIFQDPSDAKLQTFIGVMVNRLPELLKRHRNQQALLKEISNAALKTLQE